MAETELRLSAISGATLMDLEFKPQEFIVKGLLPKGLSILGGAPKIGKSWLMLELRFDETNCVWNKISDDAEDETKKLPPEMVAFVDFVKRISFYEGGNTQLAECFNAHSGCSVTAKVLKQKMNRWRHPFQSATIKISF